MKRAIIAAVRLFGCGAGLALVYFGTMLKYHRHLAALQREINEALLEGNSSEQVESWLAGQHFESSKLGALSDGECGIVATVHNSSWYGGWLVASVIEIEFYFDRTGNLECVFFREEYY